MAFLLHINNHLFDGRETRLHYIYYFIASFSKL